MAKKPRKSISLSQNFLNKSQLAHSLVRESSISLNDLVYEIGPGKGILTVELAQIARQVVAIEKDRALGYKLKGVCRHLPNVKIVIGDFLRHHVSAKEYKIFANIPYHITAKIVRKILFVAPSPSEAYLIVQKKAAEKFAGTPTETQFSLLTKPKFELKIIRHLQRTDFTPVPNVDSVLLHIKKRGNPLFNHDEYSFYQTFVCFGFSGRKRNLRLTFKPIFTYTQWKRLSKNLSFPINAKPTTLTIEQWLGLFEFFQHGVSDTKQTRIREFGSGQGKKIPYNRK